MYRLPLFIGLSRKALAKIFWTTKASQTAKISTKLSPKLEGMKIAEACDDTSIRVKVLDMLTRTGLAMLVRWLHVLMLELAVTRMILGTDPSRDKVIRAVLRILQQNTAMQSSTSYSRR